MNTRTSLLTTLLLTPLTVLKSVAIATGPDEPVDRPAPQLGMVMEQEVRFTCIAGHAERVPLSLRKGIGQRCEVQM